MLLLGDCLERMAELADGSVDMILADLPYGTTACKWDTIIPFEPMWAQFKRIAKPNAAIVLTASQPFTSALVMSNPKGFKYSWVWRKNRPTGFANAKRRPLKTVEDVCVFHARHYYPQGLVRVDRRARNSRSTGGDTTGAFRFGGGYTQEWTNYPRDVLDYRSDEGAKVHPTQKPIALMEYLIRTYTQGGETVLDPTMGSGTTGVACANTGRDFIGIERDPEYMEIARNRIADAQRSAIAAE
ncbi:DNA-methyltransferase [Limimaricola cinnabarinus]|uniref:DNA-methyltransferase n=1 Tax=Limimaricola cinnabarinus TaxID=1125964 RepID=UPI00248FB60D|nr:site-specific DNA-methyltransferase [Limimaricola cinnabarinus]